MISMSRVARLSAVGASAAMFTLGALAVPAQADDPSPAPSAGDRAGAPVTAPDRVRVAADGFATADVLANDSDPDDTSPSDLEVCRVSAPDDSGLSASIGYSYADDFDHPTRASVDVFPAGAEPGTYRVTYYACDYSYLTAGTLTVVVTKPQNVTVSKVDSRPGLVRFRNPGRRPARVAYHAPRSEHSVRFRLAPHSARTVRVHTHVIDYTITQGDRHGSSTVGSQLRGIRLPGDHHAAGSTSSARTRSRAATHRADASQEQAPVTADDAVSIPQHQFRYATVLANDSDADTDQSDLAICRVTVPDDSGLDAQISDGGFFAISRSYRAQASRAVRAAGDAPTPGIVVSAPPGVKQGTYEVTYYACDYQALTPGTLTVTVTHAVDVTARRVEGKPGVVRFHNPGPAAARISFEPEPAYAGGPAKGESGGAYPSRTRTVKVGAGRSRDVRVHARSISWFSQSTSGDFSNGRVTHIRQPAHGR